MRETGGQSRGRRTRMGLCMAVLKSPREIELMRAAGRVVHRVLDQIRPAVRPGVTTAELAAIAEEVIAASGGEALFEGVRSPSAKLPFPSAICASVNQEVVHGIPADRVLGEGDIVSVDCGVRMKGYCGDSAATFRVGEVEPRVQRLLDVTREALDLVVAEMRPGRFWSEIAGLLQEHVESAGFSVVREFVGHGIGQAMHEEPKVPNYTDSRQRKEDFRLEPGLVLAVEPMVNIGCAAVKIGDSTGWPQVTDDGCWSAHFEHTIAVTPTGVDILTDGR